MPLPTHIPRRSLSQEISALIPEATDYKIPNILRYVSIFVFTGVSMFAFLECDGPDAVLSLVYGDDERYFDPDDVASRKTIITAVTGFVLVVGFALLGHKIAKAAHKYLIEKLPANARAFVQIARDQFPSYLQQKLGSVLNKTEQLYTKNFPYLGSLCLGYLNQFAELPSELLASCGWQGSQFSGVPVEHEQQQPAVPAEVVQRQSLRVEPVDPNRALAERLASEFQAHLQQVHANELGGSAVSDYHSARTSSPVAAAEDADEERIYQLQQLAREYDAKRQGAGAVQAVALLRDMATRIRVGMTFRLIPKHWKIAGRHGLNTRWFEGDLYAALDYFSQNIEQPNTADGAQIKAYLDAPADQKQEAFNRLTQQQIDAGLRDWLLSAIKHAANQVNQLQERGVQLQAQLAASTNLLYVLTAMRQFCFAEDSLEDFSQAIAELYTALDNYQQWTDAHPRIAQPFSLELKVCYSIVSAWQHILFADQPSQLLSDEIQQPAVQAAPPPRMLDVSTLTSPIEQYVLNNDCEPVLRCYEAMRWRLINENAGADAWAELVRQLLMDPLQNRQPSERDPLRYAYLARLLRPMTQAESDLAPEGYMPRLVDVYKALANAESSDIQPTTLRHMGMYVEQSKPAPITTRYAVQFQQTQLNQLPEPALYITGDLESGMVVRYKNKQLQRALSLQEIPGLVAMLHRLQHRADSPIHSVDDLTAVDKTELQVLFDKWYAHEKPLGVISQATTEFSLSSHLKKTGGVSPAQMQWAQLLIAVDTHYILSYWSLPLIRNMLKQLLLPGMPGKQAEIGGHLLIKFFASDVPEVVHGDFKNYLTHLLKDGQRINYVGLLTDPEPINLSELARLQCSALAFEEQRGLQLKQRLVARSRAGAMMLVMRYQRLGTVALGKGDYFGRKAFKTLSAIIAPLTVSGEVKQIHQLVDSDGMEAFIPNAFAEAINNMMEYFAEDVMRPDNLHPNQFSWQQQFDGLLKHLLIYLFKRSPDLKEITQYQDNRKVRQALGFGLLLYLAKQNRLDDFEDCLHYSMQHFSIIDFNAFLRRSCVLGDGSQIVVTRLYAKLQQGQVLTNSQPTTVDECQNLYELMKIIYADVMSETAETIFTQLHANLAAAIDSDDLMSSDAFREAMLWPMFFDLSRDEGGLHSMSSKAIKYILQLHLQQRPSGMQLPTIDLYTLLARYRRLIDLNFLATLRTSLADSVRELELGKSAMDIDGLRERMWQIIASVEAVIVNHNDIPDQFALLIYWVQQSAPLGHAIVYFRRLREAYRQLYMSGQLWQDLFLLIEQQIQSDSENDIEEAQLLLLSVALLDGCDAAPDTREGASYQNRLRLAKHLFAELMKKLFTVYANDLGSLVERLQLNPDSLSYTLTAKTLYELSEHDISRLVDRVLDAFNTAAIGPDYQASFVWQILLFLKENHFDLDATSINRLVLQFSKDRQLMMQSTQHQLVYMPPAQSRFVLDFLRADKVFLVALPSHYDPQQLQHNDFFQRAVSALYPKVKQYVLTAQHAQAIWRLFETERQRLGLGALETLTTGQLQQLLDAYQEDMTLDVGGVRFIFSTWRLQMMLQGLHLFLQLQPTSSSDDITECIRLLAVRDGFASQDELSYALWSMAKKIEWQYSKHFDELSDVEIAEMAVEMQCSGCVNFLRNNFGVLGSFVIDHRFLRATLDRLQPAVNSTLLSTSVSVEQKQQAFDQTLVGLRTILAGNLRAGEDRDAFKALVMHVQDYAVSNYQAMVYQLTSDQYALLLQHFNADLPLQYAGREVVFHQARLQACLQAMRAVPMVKLDYTRLDQVILNTLSRYWGLLLSELYEQCPSESSVASLILPNAIQTFVQSYLSLFDVLPVTHRANQASIIINRSEGLEIVGQVPKQFAELDVYRLMFVLRTNLQQSDEPVLRRVEQNQQLLENHYDPTQLSFDDYCATLQRSFANLPDRVYAFKYVNANGLGVETVLRMVCASVSAEQFTTRLFWSIWARVAHDLQSPFMQPLIQILDDRLRYLFEHGVGTIAPGQAQNQIRALRQFVTKFARELDDAELLHLRGRLSQGASLQALRLYDYATRQASCLPYFFACGKVTPLESYLQIITAQQPLVIDADFRQRFASLGIEDVVSRVEAASNRVVQVQHAGAQPLLGGVDPQA